MISTQLNMMTSPVCRTGRPWNRIGTTNVGYVERMACAIGGPLVALYGLTQPTPRGVALALLGGELFYRGMTGHCPIYQALGISTARDQASLLPVEKSVTVNRPAEELYRFWRDFENLPRFMKHLQSVTIIDDRRSHWVATGPAGSTVEWNAEITEDLPNELIAWRSLEGSQVDNAGLVHFEPAPGGRGTVVRVALDYSPPANRLGATIARLFGEEPSQQVEGDLRRFKNIMEAGEIPTTEGQPSGQRTAIGQLLRQDQRPEGAGQAAPPRPKKPVQPRKPRVQEASEESFPASDPPAWTGTEVAPGEREVGKEIRD